MPVVDASVAVKWIMQEPGSDLARDLVAQKQTLIAPAHILLEAHYAVAKLLRRGLATQEQLAAAIRIVMQAVEIIVVDEHLAIEAAALSQATPTQPFNIHDCTYIAVARGWGEPLITADHGQAAFAERFGVVVQRL